MIQVMLSSSARRKENGDVIALFPDLPADMNGDLLRCV